MANIGITGHTSGIGLGLSEAFSNLGHNVFGFSRTNGYDVSDHQIHEKIYEELTKNNVDTMIINAHWGFSQVGLLYKLAERWAGRDDQTIITISSNASDGNTSFMQRYAVEKAALDKSATQIARLHAARIINIRPGYVNTPMVANVVNTPKLDVSAVVSCVLYAWSCPPEVLIREITIVPRSLVHRT
jgi:NAD(P)-dependent dehydrogenase (short-subunit alcohol dehydrogenase family)